LNVKQRMLISKKKRELKAKWYQLVKPIGNYLSKREESKYTKMKDSITEEQAIQWFAESIIDYIIRWPNEPFSLIIATWINDDYHSGYHCIADLSFERLLKKNKHEIAFYKFNKGIDFQEKVVDVIKRKKGIVVKEKVEDFNFGKPENYIKTYFIEVEKK